MNRRVRSILCIAIVLLLMVLHNDWLFRAGGPGWRLFDPLDPALRWLPADAAYRLIWLALSCAGFYLVMRWTWKHKP